MRAAPSSSGSRRRPVSTSEAPSFANARAAASPMPLPPPVTQTTFPSNRPTASSVLSRGGYRMTGSVVFASEAKQTRGASLKGPVTKFFRTQNRALRSTSGAVRVQHRRHERQPLPNLRCIGRVREPGAEASTLAMNDIRFPPIRELLVGLGLATPLLAVLAFMLEIVAG